MKTNDESGLPPVASLRGWERLGIASAATLRKAIDAGELRATRPTRRTVRILRADLLTWLCVHAVRPSIQSDGRFRLWPALSAARAELAREIARRIAGDAAELDELGKARSAIEGALLALDAEDSA